MSTADGAPVSDPHRAVRPGAGVIAAARSRALPAMPRHHRGLGGTSFDDSLIAGRRLDAGRADHHRLRSRHSHADDRDHDDRRRRRSIAHVDKGGPLQVGPESAGSRAGPACYGLGASARPSRTPMSCSGGSMPRARSAAAAHPRRRGGGSRDRAACRRTARLGRRRRRGGDRQIANARMAARSGSFRSNAVTIPAASRCCRSVAAARCTRAL